MTETEYGLPYRVSRAAWTGFYNAVLWLLIPALISQSLSGLPTSSPLAIGMPFVYSFGITITALQVLGTLTTGMAISVPFKSGSYIAEAYYIWAAVDGGAVRFSVQSVGIGLLFQPLLFLFMMPSLFSAVRSPLTYLLEQNEAALPAPDLA